jgi:hypothetical protein
VVSPDADVWSGPVQMWSSPGANVVRMWVKYDADVWPVPGVDVASIQMR